MFRSLILKHISHLESGFLQMDDAKLEIRAKKTKQKRNLYAQWSLNEA